MGIESSSAGSIQLELEGIQEKFSMVMAANDHNIGEPPYGTFNWRKDENFIYFQ
jgi:hypothetical protein